jgi:hypothetical protein
MVFLVLVRALALGKGGLLRCINVAAYSVKNPSARQYMELIIIVEL